MLQAHIRKAMVRPRPLALVALVAVLLAGCGGEGQPSAHSQAVQAEVLRQYAARLPDWAAESTIAKLEEVEDEEGRQSAMLVIEAPGSGAYRKLSAVAGRTRMLEEMYTQVEAVAACARRGELALLDLKVKETSEKERRILVAAVLKIGEIGEADAAFSARLGEDGVLAVDVAKVSSLRAVAKKKSGGHH